MEIPSLTLSLVDHTTSMKRYPKSILRIWCLTFITPDQVKARLMKTAYKAFPVSSTVVDPVTATTYVSEYDIFTVGAGYLDVGAALANSDLATGNALSPTAVYDSTQNAVYLVNAAGSTWDSSVLWGT